MGFEAAGRRKFTAEEKVQIVLAGLHGESQVSEVCRRHGITTNQFYQWRDRLIGAAKEAFSQERRGRPKEDRRRIERLEADLARKDTVIAEITEEILKVKKGLWPLRNTPS
jgi:transposase-like protein